MERSISSIVALFLLIVGQSAATNLPLVLSTWDYPGSVTNAWCTLQDSSKNALDAIEDGINYCELHQCRGTVGFGNSPDEDGETTLDALIMDGKTHDAGAVACLRNVKKAISVARKVLENTEHTMLAGELATKFAASLGFHIETLSTNTSNEHHSEWLQNSCQPNFWKNVLPDPRKSCGPYQPVANKNTGDNYIEKNADNHDTIGMIVISSDGHVVAGTSTNGLDHKISGRVGDSPVPGSGAYADQDVGAAAATGDGDVMMRFVPSYQAVESMRQGMTPQEAADDAIGRIVKKYPKFEGAIIVANKSGDFGTACHGWKKFPYTFANAHNEMTIREIECK